MFTSDFLEARQTVIDIRTFDGCALRDIVDFFYTGNFFLYPSNNIISEQKQKYIQEDLLSINLLISLQCRCVFNLKKVFEYVALVAFT